MLGKVEMTICCWEEREGNWYWGEEIGEGVESDGLRDVNMRNVIGMNCLGKS